MSEIGNTTIEAIEEEAKGIQEYLEINASDDPTELIERLSTINSHMARSGYLLAQCQRIKDEADPYKKGHVVGVICVSAVMQEFGINTGKKWEPNKLGQFFKMNRAFFSDRVQNMQLVSDLKNFTAKVNAVIEKQRDQSGTFKENYSGIVSSNLPSSFSLEIPIIVGQSPETIEVEFYASVDGPNISLELVSPGAKEWLDNEKNTIIDTEITVIESIMPGLPIIEV